ncbi:MAG TPA: galactose-1-phosphate uridylyltransferase [Candidatus Dojkabacteria bacterium]
MQKSISVNIKKKSKELKKEGTTSFYVTDPLTGSAIIHGATNSRPKAYAGEHIDCPWDDPKEKILENGDAFLITNDFPAIETGSVEYERYKILVGDLYELEQARGECLVTIYSQKHEGHWLNLPESTLIDVIGLWAKSTERSKNTKDIVYTQIFENDGPLNTMTHPHGQQYNFTVLPPFITNEIRNSEEFYKKHSKNIFEAILEVETAAKDRIVCENEHFIAFIPPGGRWPYQMRVIPKKRVLWVFELDEEQKKGLVDIITKVRKTYKKFFSGSYEPTIMMNIHQAPFDKSYKDTYGFRVEFYNTALSPTAEKLMFSLENSTGLIAYGNIPEKSAQDLREV